MKRGGVRRFLPLYVAVIVIMVLGVLAENTNAHSAVSFRSLASGNSEGPGGDAAGAAMNTPGAFDYFQRAFPKGTIPRGAYTRGVAQADAVRDKTATDVNPWQELGPSNSESANLLNPKTNASTTVSGRIDAIAADPTTCSAGSCGTMYVGTSGGGVWKTTDAGQSWSSLTDNQPILAVGAIAVDPQNPNIIYVGTGDSTHDREGIGLLRSDDGGQTWTNLGHDTFYGRAISQIIIDPRTAGNDNATLYVSNTYGKRGGAVTGGGLYASHSNPYGVFVSHDGGGTWNGHEPFKDYSYAVDSLVMDPTNPDVLYAGFRGQGVYKSTDDAQTWTVMNSGLPDKEFDAVVVAMAPSNPQVMYVSFSIATKDKNWHGQYLYQSTDGGATWNFLNNSPSACADQCTYDMPLAVAPDDPNTLYAGGKGNYDWIFPNGDADCMVFNPLPSKCNTTLMKTSDGGQSWADIAENGDNGPLHPDNHVIWIDPTNSSDVYTGTDGGLFHSSDGGQTWQDLNKGLGTILVQSLSVNNDGDIFMGSQDNGSFAYVAGSNVWQHTLGGDGGQTAADPNNTMISYNTRFGAQLIRHDFSGTENREVNVAAFAGDYFGKKKRGNFYEPYALAPSQPQNLFFGTYRIWRSQSDGGVDGDGDGSAINSAADITDWQPISFDLFCDQQPSDSAQQCADSAGGISAIAISPIDPNVVVAAVSNGEVWMTTNALAPVQTDADCDPRNNPHHWALCNFVDGVTWNRIDSGLPKRFPTSIHFAPGSSTTFYITYSGFDQNTPDSPGHLFGTTDGGQTWSNLTGTDPNTSLPDLPFSDMLVNPSNGHLYASSDYGIYASSDNGATWGRIDTGLPAVAIYQMAYFTTKGMLLVGTYGRGVWLAPAP